MANYTVDANNWGAFYKSVGATGDDDTVMVNIGENFGGTITIDSIDGDGEAEEISYTLPPGWSLDQTGDLATPNEMPNFHSISYNVVNADGVVVGIALFRGNDIHAACFTPGTKISCANGKETLVEALSEGDLVLTERNGLQPIRWIGQRQVLAAGSMVPVCFKAGALGQKQDLWVSPAHRMLLRGPKIEVLFGIEASLVAARELVNGSTIFFDRSAPYVTYIHIAFDRHEIVFANGIPSESFFPETHAVEALPSAQQLELCEIFPELAHGASAYPCAYPTLAAHEATLLRQI